MGIYNPNISTNPWTAIVPINIQPSNLEMFLFNNSNITGLDCSSIFPSQVIEGNCAIAAGVGSNTSAFGNKNYSVGWEIANSGIFVTRAIDYQSGIISTLFPFYYQVNSMIFPSGVTPGVLSMSSCSNSGKYLLTTWINQNTGKIYYKLTQNVNGFKPTKIKELKFDEITLFPNPSYNQLTLKGLNNDMNYFIINILGERVTSGDITKASPIININKLSTGIYIIKLENSEGELFKT